MSNIESPSTGVMSLVDLPYGEMPWREVIGDLAYPTDLDPDGEPVRILVDSPESTAAVRAVGGEVRWWATCQAIRHSESPEAWPVPGDVTIADTGIDGEFVVTGPGGAVVVRRVVPAVREPSPLEVLSVRLRRRLTRTRT